MGREYLVPLLVRLTVGFGQTADTVLRSAAVNSSVPVCCGMAKLLPVRTGKYIFYRGIFVVPEVVTFFAASISRMWENRTKVFFAIHGVLYPTSMETNSTSNLLVTSSYTLSHATLPWIFTAVTFTPRTKPLLSQVICAS